MYRILFTIIFLINLTSGAAAPDAYECPFEFAPLGGVWVKKLPQQYQEFHNGIVSNELKRSLESDQLVAKGGPGSIPTNFAYFKLIIYSKDSDNTIETLDLLESFDGVCFESGGQILRNNTHPDFILLRQEKDKLVETRKRRRESVTTKMTDMSKLSSLVASNPKELMRKLRSVPDEVEATLNELVAVDAELDKITRLEKRFEEGISVFSRKSSVYSDFKRQMYDPEQIIARLIDDHLMQAKKDSENIVLCGKAASLSKVVRIGIHIHSRLDLCPYCVMFLHDKTKKWNEHIHSITGKYIVSTFVSSRQEYISSSPFLLTQPFFKGSSMRLVGLSEEHFNSNLTEEQLSEYSSKGIIIKFLFLAHEISF